MAACLPILCFITLLIGYAARHIDDGPWTRWRRAFVAALLTQGVLIIMFTELLSLGRLLEFNWLIGLWSAALLGAIIAMVIAIRANGWPALPNLTTLPRMELWALIGTLTVIVLTGITAVAAPPNNWDSMTYHMARVLHWIDQHSVAHFPTHFLPQIYHGPWAEFAILHLQLLSGGDSLANTVQWFSLVGSIMAASLIARELGGDSRAQVLAAVLAATIPMAIVQASSTQNDLTAGLWLTILMYAFLRLRTHPTWEPMLMAGSALGLALLTKATMYTYTLPILVWMGIWCIRHMRWGIWRAALAIGMVALALNAGHYARNTDFFGNPLGIIPEESYHSNEIITPSVILSNVMRNSSLHLITPDKWVNAAIRVIIRILHIPLGLDMSDPRTTFGGMEFRQPPFNTNEDSTGNLLHFVLIVGAIFLLWKWRARPPTLVAYSAVIIAGFLLFCATVVWMPWNSRLHTGLFLLWAPLIAVLFTRALRLRWVSAMVAILLLAATPWVLHNETRPLVGFGPDSTVFNTSRVDQMFRARPEIRDEYLATADAVAATGCDQIGLISNDRDFWEYALWNLIQQRAGHPVHITQVNVANASSKHESANEQMSPCILITIAVEQNRPIIIQGRSYHQVWQSGSLRILAIESALVHRSSQAQ